MDLIEKQKAYALMAQGGVAPQFGQNFGSQVWNGTGFQNQANPNDPNQQFTWGQSKSSGMADSGYKRFQDMTDPNSEYSKGFLGMFMRLAANTGPSQDQLFSMNKRLGGMSSASSAAMASRQLAAQQSRSGEQVMEAFTKGMYGNESLAQGYLGQSGQMQSDITGKWLEKYKIDEEIKARDKGFLGGIINQGLGLVGGLLTGGLSTAAGAAVEGFSGLGERIKNMDIPGIPQAADYLKQGLGGDGWSLDEVGKGLFNFSDVKSGAKTSFDFSDVRGGGSTLGPAGKWTLGGINNQTIPWMQDATGWPRMWRKP
jgi:hypothetical protein